MKTRYVILLSFLSYILMSTVFQIVRINDALPNLCIILSIVFATLYSEKEAYVFAMVYGIMQDVFLGKVLGVNLLLYLIIVYVVSRAESILFKGNYLTPVFLVFMATGFYHIGVYFFMFFLQSTIPFEMMLPKIITEIIYNSIIGVFVYAFYFKRLNGYKLGDFNA